MGFLEKFKNLIYDPVEEPVLEEKKPELKPEPPKEEPKVQPKPEPRPQNILKDEEIEELISERELFKSEQTFKFPMEVEPEPEPPRRNVLYRREETITEVVKTESHHFTPSPIVSPVYGIIDQKIIKPKPIEKKETPKKDSNVSTKEINIDEIRKKAYGTLEDELERTMSDDDKIDFEEETDVLDLSEIKMEDTVDKTIQKPKESEPKENKESLFDMIDSMYQTKEEEND